MVDNAPHHVSNRPSLVSEAHEAAEKLARENERLENNIAKLQELKAWETLAGKSDGATPTQEPKEETAKEYSERIMKGKL